MYHDLSGVGHFDALRVVTLSKSLVASEEAMSTTHRDDFGNLMTNNLPYAIPILMRDLNGSGETRQVR